MYVEGKSEPWLTLQHTQATPYLSMASVRVHLIRLSEIDWSESLPSYGEIDSAVREVISAQHRIKWLGEVGKAWGLICSGVCILILICQNVIGVCTSTSRFHLRFQGVHLRFAIFFSPFCLNSMSYPVGSRSVCMVQNWQSVNLSVRVCKWSVCGDTISSVRR